MGNSPPGSVYWNNASGASGITCPGDVFFEVNGAIVKHKGKRCGVFKDENGQLEIIDAVCPHLGCGLKWNQADLSWDCPCHGSRFDTKGNILNNPTIKQAEIWCTRDDSNVRLSPPEGDALSN